MKILFNLSLEICNLWKVANRNTDSELIEDLSKFQSKMIANIHPITINVMLWSTAAPVSSCLYRRISIVVNRCLLAIFRKLNNFQFASHIKKEAWQIKLSKEESLRHFIISFATAWINQRDILQSLWIKLNETSLLKMGWILPISRISSLLLSFKEFNFYNVTYKEKILQLDFSRISQFHYLRKDLYANT